MLSREDLTETHKEDVEAWEKEFGATDIVVDDCFAEEKTWKIFAIFLPVVVVLLFGIAITATIVTRKMRGSKKKKAQKNKEKNKNKRKSTGEHGQYNWAYADDDNFETLTDDSD